MKDRKCPACGALVTEDTAKCPDCGLEGLNLRFLNKAGYEKWVNEVLKPHKAAVDAKKVKVYAGLFYGLILTADGVLYGLGSNEYGQIDDNRKWTYDQPHRMATDVISAAAGYHYAVFVTRDGKVHLRGRGELKDRFPGFSGAKEVYAGIWGGIWIVDQNDQIWGFGHNHRGILKEQTRTRFREFPELVLLRNDVDDWTDKFKWEDSSGDKWIERSVRFPSSGPTMNEFIKDRIRETKQYRDMVKQFGTSNVEIGWDETWLGHLPLGSKMKGLRRVTEYSESISRYSIKPALYLKNEVLFEPIRCPECQWMLQTQHRCGSAPVRLEACPEGMANAPGIKKVCSADGCRDYAFLGNGDLASEEYLCLQEDGTVELKDGKVWQWTKNKICDLSWGGSFLLFACRNGNIIRSIESDWDLEDYRFEICRWTEESDW